MIVKTLKQPVILFIFIGFSVAFLLALQSIIAGSIPFWYDPARDLLLAVDNLKKPTLIGPPAGIPGIFYGPYWIWLLSVGLLFSKDPRVVTIIVLLVPYFTIFPFIMWRISKQWGIVSSAVLGVLFLLTFNEYAKQLWNPNLAPLFFLCAAYILSSSDFVSHKRKELLKVLLGGLLTGLVVNFHISFGIGVAAGICLFFIVNFIRLIMRKIRAQEKQKLLAHFVLSVVLFYIGVGIAFLPFLLFEFRHGFNQTQAAVTTLLNPFATVGVLGLSDQLIISHFLRVFFKLTEFNILLVFVALAIAVANVMYLWNKSKKIVIPEFTIKIGLLSILVLVSVFYFYLTSKNPVWEYHFIGVEILFLLLIGALMSKLVALRYFVMLWVAYLLIMRIPVLISESSKIPVADTLYDKKVVVKNIASDANSNAYEVLVYNPAIYTYDYDYLFLQMEGKRVTKNLNELRGFIGPVYLVIPSKSDAKTEDYINAQTRGVAFSKSKDWKAGKNTRIIKLTNIK